MKMHLEIAWTIAQEQEDQADRALGARSGYERSMCKTQTADRGDMATSKCDFDTGLVKLQGRNEEIEREYKEKIKRKEAEIEGQRKQLEE